MSHVETKRTGPNGAEKFFQQASGLIAASGNVLDQPTLASIPLPPGASINIDSTSITFGASPAIPQPWTTTVYNVGVGFASGAAGGVAGAIPGRWSRRS